MNVTEVTRLCRVIRSVSPSQQFTAETPAVWAVPLADVSLADALEAVQRIIKRQPYVGVHDIFQEVSKVRAARMQAVDGTDGLVPNVDPDDVAGFAAERRAILGAAAAGTLDPDAYRAGGVTLSGARPWKPAGEIPADRPGVVEAMVRSVAASRERV